MKINTKFFGEVDIDKENIIEFPNGIPGFEQEREFVLIDINEQGTYSSLQSVNHEGIALVVSNPYLFFSDYEFDLDHNTINLLNIDRQEDVMVLSVLTLKDPFKDTTANLQAPIIINYKKNKAKQLILNDTNYQTKEPIFAEGKGVESDAHSES